MLAVYPGLIFYYWPTFEYSDIMRTLSEYFEYQNKDIGKISWEDIGFELRNGRVDRIVWQIRYYGKETQIETHKQNIRTTDTSKLV